MPGSTLVVGFDGSSSARAAVRYAATAARERRGRLVVAAVHPLPPGDLDEGATAALLADHERTARSALDALGADPPAELDGVTWEAVAQGADSPADGLLEVAAREDAVAIVVGTHGRGRISALLGSVAHDLLRHSDRPVVTIPPRAVAALGEEAA